MAEERQRRNKNSKRARKGAEVCKTSKEEEEDRISVKGASLRSNRRVRECIRLETETKGMCGYIDGAGGEDDVSFSQC